MHVVSSLNQGPWPHMLTGQRADWPPRHLTVILGFVHSSDSYSRATSAKAGTLVTDPL